MSFSFTADISGQVTGTYSEEINDRKTLMRSHQTIQKVGNSLMDVYSKMRADTMSLAFRGFPSATLPLNKGVASAIVRSLGDSMAPEDKDVATVTNVLPAFSKPCWDLASCLHSDKKTVSALLVREGIFGDGLVSVISGSWKLNNHGEAYLKHIKNTPFEEMYVGLQMIGLLEPIFLTCVINGTVQSNLPWVEEAKTLGLMKSVGHAVTLTDRGYRWFFCKLSENACRQMAVSIFGLGRLDSSTCVRFLGAAPSQVIGDLILNASNLAGAFPLDMENLVAKNLPFSKWAALSVRIRGTPVYQRIAKKIKERL